MSQSNREPAFSGYRWDYFDSLGDGPLRSRAQQFLTYVGWQALQQYAANKRNGMSCQILPNIGLGYNHMVRIIEFEDGVRWVARLRMPPLKKMDDERAPELLSKSELNIKSEHTAMALVQEKTNIPIPEVYATETRWDCEVQAPFMLMDCLPGNVGMDLDMKIPPRFKSSFFRKLACIHVELSTVQLPKIGIIVSRNEDGTYQQGSIPGLGGPFDTATKFFQAWASKTEFGLPIDRLREASGPYADEIIPSVASFPEAIRRFSSRISVRDHGPFPLCHGDFGHNNMIVDDEYHVLGVIDWESAFAGPWEVFADFPLTLSTIPPAMDAPWNHDEMGCPKDPEIAQKYADQRDYIAAVKEQESEGGGDHYLSDALGDSRRQQLVTAMRLYQGGKPGFYSKLADTF
ncbi:hypothetical protein HD806DRAFT_19503 [Xylariaceae sp. AK1471]|nr:hypothetical protein HD806DRAFT_19503 [Xylariaceae sp. AK1471]